MTLTPEQQKQYFATQSGLANPLSPLDWLAKQTGGTTPAPTAPMPAPTGTIDPFSTQGAQYLSQLTGQKLAPQTGTQTGAPPPPGGTQTTQSSMSLPGQPTGSSGNGLLDFKTALDFAVNLARKPRNESAVNNLMMPHRGTVAASSFGSILSNLNKATDTFGSKVMNSAMDTYQANQPSYDTITMGGSLYQIQRDGQGKMIGTPELILGDGGAEEENKNTPTSTPTSTSPFTNETTKLTDGVPDWFRQQATKEWTAQVTSQGGDTNKWPLTEQMIQSNWEKYKVAHPEDTQTAPSITNLTPTNKRDLEMVGLISADGNAQQYYLSSETAFKNWYSQQVALGKKPRTPSMDAIYASYQEWQGETGGDSGGEFSFDEF